MVKNFLKEGKIHGYADKNIFGHTSVPFKAITKKPLTAIPSELAENARSRSAKLRIAERI
jgi:16S rRNA (cytosine1402-N4)-methyltransferase